MAPRKKRNRKRRSPRGAGGTKRRSPRNEETGLTEIKEARLAAVAVRTWHAGQRWPLDVSEADFAAVKKLRPLTARERTVLSAMKDVDAKDARARGIGRRNVLDMDAQNMEAERGSRSNMPPPVTNVIINLADGDRDHLEESRRLKEERRQRLAGQTLDETTNGHHASNGHGSNGDAGPAGPNGQSGPLGAG